MCTLHTKKQLSSLKNKKVGKTVQNVCCAVHDVLCAHPNCQKVQYKNVYEIQIHTCTPNYSSLAWKTKKLEKWCKMCAVQSKICTARTLIGKKYSVRMIAKSKFTPAHQITALLLEKQKSWENGAKCVVCNIKMCPVHTIFVKKYSKVVIL